MSSPDQWKEAFERDGFVHVRGFLNADELQEVYEALEAYKKELVPSFRPESHKALYDDIGGRRALKQLVDMHDSSPFFNGMLTGERATHLAVILLGENALPQTLEYFEKCPEVGTPTPAHQDGFYFCLKPNHAVTLWLALDDCNQENGCLHYVKGSHRGGVMDHNSSGVSGFSQGLAKPFWSEKDVAHLEVNKGDVLAHHSLTIHFADANTSVRQRRSIGMIFYGQSAKRDEEAWQRYQENLSAQRKMTAK